MREGSWAIMCHAQSCRSDDANGDLHHRHVTVTLALVHACACLISPSDARAARNSASTAVWVNTIFLRKCHIGLIAGSGGLGDCGAPLRDITLRSAIPSDHDPVIGRTIPDIAQGCHSRRACLPYPASPAGWLVQKPIDRCLQGWVALSSPLRDHLVGLNPAPIHLARAIGGGTHGQHHPGAVTQDEFTGAGRQSCRQVSKAAGVWASAEGDGESLSRTDRRRADQHGDRR